MCLLICLFPFYLFAQNRYDVVIDEIMADPTPQIGLPNNEWIELKNTSNLPINLLNWRIGDATSQSGPLPTFILQPDSFVIVCTGSAVAALAAFGTTISVTSFPSLDNAGDKLFLKAANGKIIHAVNYTDNWYQNAVKKDGGWTLEMIDTKNPCTGAVNWKASTHPSGGTPGKKNSVDGMNTDQTAPSILNTYTINATTVVIVYNEPIDSTKGATSSNYALNNGITVIAATTLPPLFNEVQLTLSAALQPQQVYLITAANISDCSGNTIAAGSSAKAGLPEELNPQDIIINEILFNPRSNAFDYVELYNRSNKIADASRLYIANRNSSNTISSIILLSATPRLIFPGEYIVLTEDADNLALNYLVKTPGNVLTFSSLPSFPDDKGFVLVLNGQGAEVDEVKYNKSWHFKLIDNEDGVALERIDPDGPSQDPANWHSAASTAGYGTPTYKNSQYKLINAVNATITVSPKIFSPDNDGRDDIATIQYIVTTAGYIANLTLFDGTGRPVRNLVRNGTLGLTGYWNWDGLDDKGNKLPVGSYVLLTEIFNLQGKKEQFKNVVILARPLR